MKDCKNVVFEQSSQEKRLGICYIANKDIVSIGTLTIITSVYENDSNN